MERSSTGVHGTLSPSLVPACVGIRQALQILALLLPGCATLGQLRNLPRPFPPL